MQQRKNWKLTWILTPTISFGIGLLLGFKDARHLRGGWTKALLGWRWPLKDTWDIVLNGFEWAFVFAAIATIILTIVFVCCRPWKAQERGNE